MGLHLDLDLDGASGRPRRVHIERALRDAVRSGRLAPGTRLPSTRRLCADLRVSRGVVAEAYAQLAAEGYLSARRGAGTVVVASRAESHHRTEQASSHRAMRYDISPFKPALHAFPRTAWLAALSRASRASPDEALGYPEPAGAAALRASLAAHLARSRGVRATPQQIVVLTSLRQGIGLLFSVLAASGAKSVAVERPGWRGVRETAADGNLRVVEVPVDGEGIVVEELLDRRVDVVAVTPAHQYPTGAVLSAARRTALVDWAQRTGSLLVEDDYDAEYRYDRRPIGALQGLAPSSIVYGGSASKTLAPSIRLGWLALPEALVEPIVSLQRVRGGMPATLQQLALADLIERGDLDRHLRRQRRNYRRQRDALLGELQRTLPELPVQGAAAGLYVVLGLPDGIDEQAVLSAARARRIAPEGLGGEPPGLVVGYANLPEAAVAPAVKELAASVREAQASVREAQASSQGSVA